MKVKILVLGSNSFSGASFINYALSNNYSVLGVSRSKQPNNLFLPYSENRQKVDSFKFHQLDINKNINEIVDLIKQQQMLLGTEGVDLEFDDEAVHEIAKIAADMNHTVENIGARRLHTVMEKIMEEISFDADEKAGETITIGTELVVERVGEMLKKQDLQKFIL